MEIPCHNPGVLESSESHPSWCHHFWDSANAWGFRLWNRSGNVRETLAFPISRRPVPDGIVWYCRAAFPVNLKKKTRSEYLHDLHSHGVKQKISSTAVQVQEIRKGEKQMFWVCIPLGFQHTQLNKGVVLVQYPPPPKKKTSCSTSLSYSSFQGKLPRKKKNLPTTIPLTSFAGSKGFVQGGNAWL